LTITVNVLVSLDPVDAKTFNVAVKIPALAYVCAISAGGSPGPVAAAVPSPKERSHRSIFPCGAELIDPSKLTANGATPEEGTALRFATGGTPVAPPPSSPATATGTPTTNTKPTTDTTAKTRRHRPSTPLPRHRPITTEPYLEAQPRPGKMAWARVLSWVVVAPAAILKAWLCWRTKSSLGWPGVPRSM
jgi:hypothetical protein